MRQTIMRVLGKVQLWLVNPARPLVQQPEHGALQHKTTAWRLQSKHKEVRTQAGGAKVIGVVMGTVYIDDMQVRYDVSGGSEIRFSNGMTVVVVPDFRDVSLYLVAEGLGYGRQIGQLIRDRCVMHCVLCSCVGVEPWYILADRWENTERVDFLLSRMNSMGNVAKLNPVDDQALMVATTMLKRGGCLDA